jgi:hypothetical protein
MKFWQSSVEAGYVLIMLNFFKTTKNFSQKSLCLGGFVHPVGDAAEPISFICPNGKIISWVFATYLIGRHVFKENKFINKIILLMGIGFSMLNANVFVYMLPVFSAETYSLFF